MAQAPEKRIAIAIELNWNLPWHLDVYQGIIDYGRDHGWNCQVDPYLDGIIGNGDLSCYDGVVGRLDRRLTQLAMDFGVSAVTVLHSRSELDLPSVRNELTAFGRLAADHLVQQGYRRLGYVSDIGASKPIEGSIFGAFAQAITKQGLAEPVITSFNHGGLRERESSKAVRNAMTEWIVAQDKPIGLYVYNVFVARYLTQICEQLGLRVPKDVGIVCHAADVLTASTITPTLSAIDFDYYEQGYQAAVLLNKLMLKQSADPLHRVLSPKRVIVRESTDVFLCDDELVSQAMHYIAEHSRQTLRVEDITEALLVSRRTLDRRFEQVRGRSVGQEIARLRFEHTERVLLETDLPIARVAELCGFGSPSHFTQFFSKHAGLSPSAYRKQRRG